MKSFWDKVEKTDTCWNWTGAKTPRGYGLISYKGKNIYTHRLSWFLHTGNFPKRNILHDCDNPSCIRPTHLREGTQKENVADAILRGRWSPVTRKKLTEKQVRYIRYAYNKKLENQIQLAARYGIDQSTVSYIISRKTWKQYD